MVRIGNSRLSLPLPGDDKRDPCRLFIKDLLLIPTVRCIAITVIAGEDHQSVVGQPVLVTAHSMGGMVAQWLAVRRPDLVRRLVLTATLASVGTAGVPPQPMHAESGYWRFPSPGRVESDPSSARGE